jgi:hypothetical protein
VISLPSSNGVPVSFGADYFAPMLDSTGLLDEPRLLRERYLEEGYLLLRGVLDPGLLWHARAAYFASFPPGYLKPGTSPAEGVYSGHYPPGLPAYGVRGHPAHAFTRSRCFTELTAARRLGVVAETLLGGPANLVPRKVLRHFDLGAKQASRAHVDHAYPSGAGGQMVTVWIPIGHCPLDTGGLIYLRGSHRLGRAVIDAPRLMSDRPDDSRPISHDLEWTARTLGGKWLWTDFRAGDVALHCPGIVHASLDITTEVMRLSADIRYQQAGERIYPAWSRAWAADDGA